MRVRALAVVLLLLFSLAACRSSGAVRSTLQGPPGPASRWEVGAPLPEPVSEVAVAQLDGRIYVVGGYPASRIVSRSVQVYDIATDRWELATPLPVPLHHTMAGGVNGKLYVLGGDTANPEGRPATESTDAVYEYDPGTRAWTRRSSMPAPRGAGGAAVIGGRIYVAGGRPPRGSDFAVYDPAADRWTVLPPLPTQRNHLVVSANGGKLYVAGGRFEGGVGSEMTGILEVFDPATNRWERKASMLTPRGGVNGVAVQGCLYVFGGEGNDADRRGMFEQMEVYDPSTDTWFQLEPIPTPVHGVSGAGVNNGRIHLVGGGTARGGTSGSTLHQVFRTDRTCSARGPGLTDR